MPAEFSIIVDPARDLVRITMGGFFEAEDIERFAATQQEAYRQLRSAPNQHVTLVDMREMNIQSQESVARFQARLADPRIASRRIAFVYALSLARMQIRRAAEGRPAAWFQTVSDAEEWLLAA